MYPSIRLFFFSDILNMYSPFFVIFNIPAWDSILMFLVRALKHIYVEKGYMRLLLDMERNEEWQFMTDIQALSLFFLMVILADSLHL